MRTPAIGYCDRRLGPAPGCRSVNAARASLPYAVVSATAGARRTGISARQLWQELRGVVQMVAIQAAVTGVVTVGFSSVGSPKGIAAGAGALAGLVALGAILTRTARGSVREAATLLRGAVRGRV